MAVTNYSSKNYDQFCEFYQAQVERYRNGESVPSHLIWMIQFGSRSFYTENINVSMAIPIRAFDVDKKAFEILECLDSFCRQLVRNLKKHEVYKTFLSADIHDSNHYLIKIDLFLEKMLLPKLDAETAISFTYETSKGLGTDRYTVVAFRKGARLLQNRVIDVIEQYGLNVEGIPPVMLERKAE
ncbi:hypothetical protein [Simkania negevensis]|nr:hypothetical protein [Simkania negevensis]